MRTRQSGGRAPAPGRPPEHDADMQDKQSAIVELLLNADDETFRAVVNDELREFNRPSSSIMRNAVDPAEMGEVIRAALRDPRLLRRWYTTVVVMQKHLEGQFAANAADLAAKVKDLQMRGKRREVLFEQVNFEKWRASALRVKTGLETRLVEARYLMDRDGVTFLGEHATTERNAAYARVRVLEDAIRRHREKTLAEVNENLFEQTEYDEELWKYVS